MVDTVPVAVVEHLQIKSEIRQSRICQWKDNMPGEVYRKWYSFARRKL